VLNAWHQPNAQTLAAGYRVQTGDTLYSIAFQFGLDYRVLAQANQLPANGSIYPGQLLKMKASRAAPGRSSRASSQAARGGAVKVYHREPEPRLRVYSSPRWRWPLQGPVISGFSSAYGGNAGIDIAGSRGQAVLAAASGQVVYAGDGIRGYGNLLIIKHNKSYLSAYAYNQSLAVSLGQWVKAGQRVATVGKHPTGRFLLHFEIRKNGRPVSPTTYLRR
jgi:lipoprotein NlpD